MELCGYNVGVNYIICNGKCMGILYFENGSNICLFKVYYDCENLLFVII